MSHPLPIDAVLPELLETLECTNRAILQAEPGAGKTTRVPVAISAAPWCDGRVLVLEPRRLAARSAAAHVAAQRGEKPGESIGYRVRLDSRVSSQTRIEFVTEGVFCRQIATDPELGGVSTVVFDEFHERNLDGDLGLALALDCQQALRSDLRILVMSATLAVEEISACLDGIRSIHCPGRSFPVRLRHAPCPDHIPTSQCMAQNIEQALAANEGSILCFLPGSKEIRQTAERLEGRLPPNVDLSMLYGAMDPGSQDHAIRPASVGRRKVVLATPIAESSLTIEDISIVIDSGLRRAPRHDVGTGLTRLETVRAARSSIEQRTGRAGRTRPGIAIRLWDEAKTATLPAQETPEILASELSNLVLRLADWGITQSDRLRWITPPPAPAISEAKSRLLAFGALDESGRITPHGRQIARMPVSPQLGHMIVCATRSQQAHEAALLAVLLTEPGLGGSATDIGERLDNFRTDRSARAKSAARLARRMTEDLTRGEDPAISVGGLLSLAFPDRIARSRGRGNGYLMANGTGVHLIEGDRLVGTPYLVVADLIGSAQAARILSAAPIDPAEIRTLHTDKLETRQELVFNETAGIFRMVRRQVLGALILQAETVSSPDPDETAAALCELVRKRGLELLPWDDSHEALRTRLAYLHRCFPDDWPEMDRASLARACVDWLLPFVGSARGPGEVKPEQVRAGLWYRIEQQGRTRQQADKLAPSEFVAPSGRRHSLDYSGDAPRLRIRVQELFGLCRHPTIGESGLPIELELLSPALRPIQRTSDLPGFWGGSWADVCREMRGRYPKHDWPDDPANAEPARAGTRRAR